MTLRVWLWVTWLVGLMCFCFSILAIIDPTLVFDVISGLALIGLVVGFPVTLIMGFAIWRNFSRLWMMPSLLCLFFAFSPRIARPIGQSYNDRRFKASLHDYEAVVRQLKKRDVPSRAVLEEISVNEIKLPSTVIDIQAARCSDGEIVALFLTSAAGRIHKGYLYRGCDDETILRRERGERRLFLRQITGNWYYFSE